MELMERIAEYEGRKKSGMTTSDRVSSAREVKALILEINEIYKETKEVELMDAMKRLTILKKRVDKRLKGRQSS
jgi:hypothetical protein